MGDAAAAGLDIRWHELVAQIHVSDLPTYMTTLVRARIDLDPTYVDPGIRAAHPCVGVWACGRVGVGVGVGVFVDAGTCT